MNILSAFDHSGHARRKCLLYKDFQKDVCMRQESIAKASAQAINDGLLDLAFGRYESAEQRFDGVVKDLESRGTQFRPYLWTAAFGCGLAKGMCERPEGLRTVPEIAVAAKHLYDTFMTFQRVPSDPERYKSLGYCYAKLGIEDEGMEVLDLSRHDDSLSFYKLGSMARNMVEEDVKTEKFY